MSNGPCRWRRGKVGTDALDDLEARAEKLRELELWYDDVLVGHVRNVVHSDDTWHGVIALAIQRDAPLHTAIRDFIAFCEEWNERQLGATHPPGAAEFRKHAGVIDSGKWVVKSTGSCVSIDEAPVFFRGGEVTWRANRAATAHLSEGDSSRSRSAGRWVPVFSLGPATAVIGLAGDAWSVEMADGQVIPLASRPQAFLHLLEGRLEDVAVIVADSIRALGLVENQLPPFPFDEAILAGLRSSSGYWEDLALTRVEERSGVLPDSISSALGQLAAQGATQRTRHRAKRLWRLDTKRSGG